MCKNKQSNARCLGRSYLYEEFPVEISRTILLENQTETVPWNSFFNPGTTLRVQTKVRRRQKRVRNQLAALISSFVFLKGIIVSKKQNLQSKWKKKKQKTSRFLLWVSETFADFFTSAYSISWNFKEQPKFKDAFKPRLNCVHKKRDINLILSTSREKKQSPDVLITCLFHQMCDQQSVFLYRTLKKAFQTSTWSRRANKPLLVQSTVKTSLKLGELDPYHYNANQQIAEKFWEDLVWTSI